jgi:hypothetical protein
MEDINVREGIYKPLTELPQEELIETLMAILPPGQIKALLDGTVFLVHVYGTNKFDTVKSLDAVGIPDDDPRTDVYQTLRGALVPVDIRNALRAHARKTDTIAKEHGGIQVWHGRNLAWWVPLENTARYTSAVEQHIAEFEKLRDSSLLENYDQMRADATQKYRQASAQSWKTLNSINGGAGISQEDYIRASMEEFRRRFPLPEEIQQAVHMELEAAQPHLPQAVASIYDDFRQYEIERQKAEVEALQAQIDSEHQQQRMAAIDEAIRREKLQRAQEERKEGRTIRERLIREQMAPEMQRLEEIMTRFSASTIQVASEIIEAVKVGKPVSNALKKSWKLRLDQLRALSPDNPLLDTAIDALSGLANSTRQDGPKPTQSQIRLAQASVEKTLETFVRNNNLEMAANDIWTLIQDGQANEALRQIREAQGMAQNKMVELEALSEFLVDVGASSWK